MSEIIGTDFEMVRSSTQAERIRIQSEISAIVREGSKSPRDMP
jgi:hypothetical protein